MKIDRMEGGGMLAWTRSGIRVKINCKEMDRHSPWIASTDRRPDRLAFQSLSFLVVEGRTFALYLHQKVVRVAESVAVVAESAAVAVGQIEASPHSTALP